MRNLKECILSLLLVLMAVPVLGQRMTDRLDRGLVVVKTDAGMFCTWRVLAEEYYDVKYNIYRDGTKLNGDHPLEVSNFLDASGGNENSQYTVTTVVRGKESVHSKIAIVWAQNYLEITPDHGDLKSTYVPNDACCADVDGDGQLEILLKFDNQSWASADYPKAGYEGEYFIIEVYKLDGRKLWWIDLGPNMADFQNNEQNIIAYDWDEDGRAETVMRASDGTVIHMADGTTYEIGDPTKNFLAATNNGQWFVHEGQEFLVYMDGATGKPYQVMDYPLKRLEAGETSLEAAWGDGYGHRSTKHFFGAPCLDGRKASIFLARGIYTKHKMVALDVNPDTHELTERWRWTNNTPGSSWYAQGYHNYSIADVDWDGRDEICFGSMVIDDNGHGLSTTGLGHGDAHHVGDFNPYIHGQELYACNEDRPDNNYRDATTSKIYYRQTSSNDDGRAMMGNFSNVYPGCLGRSGHDTAISSVTNEHIPEDIAFDVNFRIYWDGDLLEETFNGTGTRNSTGRIYKPGVGDLLKLEGSLTNNDTKATPCYQGDILGDWREEVIMRTKDNKIRIYTTTIPTDWRIPTLWHDHQYRQAMAWQMCGYNQPPHVSYFLGELEGITQAPPPLTTTDRILVNDGGAIFDIVADEDTPNIHWLLADTNAATVEVKDGCSPSIVTVNTPSWVQGNDNNDQISTTLSVHTLTGGAFTGDMRLVKQGDGILVLPKVTETYSGPTDVWAGTLRFDGTMENSKVWLNRFAVLESDGGQFKKGIRMDYGSMLCPGEHGIETDTLALGFGSRIVFDVEVARADCVKANVLKIEKKDWQYGPKYSTPVFEVCRPVLPTIEVPYELEGKYLLVDANKIEGSVGDIELEGLDGLKASLIQEDGKIYLNVEPLRQADDVRWDGGEYSTWDFAHTENFLLSDGTKGFFVTGDRVTFGDEAALNEVFIGSEVSPASLVFENDEQDYTLSGIGSIIGGTSLIKRGAGNLTILNTNRLTGGIVVEDGSLTIQTLANVNGAEYGALGGVDNLISLRQGGTLVIDGTIVSSQMLEIGEGGGSVQVNAGKSLTQNGAIRQMAKTSMEKNGGGMLTIGSTVKLDTLVVNQGTVQGSENGNGVHQYPAVIILNGGSLKDPDYIYSYSSNSAHVVVPEDMKATWTLDSRCDYKGRLTGKGELTVRVTSVRCNMQGDWSGFEGTLNFQNQKTGKYDPLLQWNNTYGLGKATVKGDFENNGKDVTIGRFAENVSVTGSGRTTLKRMELKVNKTRSGFIIPAIEVAGSLSITDAITITHTGYDFKVGDMLTLWKAGSFQSTSDTVVELPELPDGLYWDTSELLKKDGKLKVTDVPTGIKAHRTPVSQMEKLDRGLVAFPISKDKVFVSWRFLGTDDADVSFRLIKNGEKILTEEFKGATSMITDGTVDDVFQIVTLQNGQTVETSPVVRPWTKSYLELKLNRPDTGAQGGTYSPNDCSVGDVDGDGQYEIFVKWDPTTSKDNSQGDKTDNVYLDCYKIVNGTSSNCQLLWRIDLGVNIRAGAHYTQFMVYDFDGDGRAELMCKTAPGSKDGQGNYVNQVATDEKIKVADNLKDWRTEAGRINGGQEYLTVFNGQTGAAIHTIAYYPNRNARAELSEAEGTFNWDDRSGKKDRGDYGNRGERYLAAVAYLVGPDEKPSGIFCRGYYTFAYIWAVDFDGEELKTRWLHSSDKKTSYTLMAADGQTETITSNVCTSGLGRYTMYANGNHNLSIADVDGDGKDEVIWGSAALDDNGRMLYAVGFGHGDAIHLGDLDPDRLGLELFDVHEEKGDYAWDLHDAATGEIIWKGGQKGQDNGRGVAADIVADSRGYEFWSSYGGFNNAGRNQNPFNAITGEEVGSSKPSMNFRIYWDGDPYDELLDGTSISKYGTGSLMLGPGLSSIGAVSMGNSSSCNGTKATPCLSADIFGDWREEVIFWSKDDNATLNIYSTAYETDYRFPTLMHDHTYRMAVAWQNTAYNQPPHLGFYLPDFIARYNPTGIDKVRSEAVESEKYYDLRGVQVKTPTKGIYIYKGKKVIK